MRKKILYLQYTNPGGYPPLEHSSRILADRGWSVVFLGTGASGAGNLVSPGHRNIRVRLWPFFKGGILQKIYYAYFGIWCLCYTLIWKPHWIYASDPLICPIIYIIKKIKKTKILYHEHDSIK